MEALLKASEASALMGLSVRHVQRMAKSGELPYQTHMNERNRPEYLFPLSSLPDAAQQKYFAEHAPAALPAATPAKAKKADKPAACKPLEAYTAEERGEIGYWITNASLAAANSNNTTGNRNWNGSAGVADLSITPYIIYCTV